MFLGHLAVGFAAKRAALMVALYVGLVFGPPPPDDKAMAWAGIAFLPLFLWAYWFDRHREALDLKQSLIEGRKSCNTRRDY